MEGLRHRNIIFVQLTGLRGRSGTGGGLEFYERLAKHLVAMGESVYAITNNLDDYGFLFLGERRFVANFRNINEGVFSMFFFDRKRLKNELKRICKNFDLNDSVFVTVDPFPMDISGALMLKKFGARVAVTMHHITPSPLWHPMRRGITRVVPSWLISVRALIAAKLFDIPVFLDNRRIAESTGWNIDKLYEHYSALEHYDLKECKKTKNVVFVGRIAYNKGVIDLIQAFALIREVIPEAKLFMVGSNYIKSKTDRLIEKYALQDRIRITGYLNNELKDLILDDASVMLFPSYEEGWSLAVMEAVDHGILPITYDLPAYDYLGQEAVKARPGNIMELSSLAIHYLNNETERCRKVRKIQRSISSYTTDFVATHWLNFIDHV